jgi:hypothetical protein
MSTATDIRWKGPDHFGYDYATTSRGTPLNVRYENGFGWRAWCDGEPIEKKFDSRIDAKAGAMRAAEALEAEI